jgi:translation initiation factor eIF-2B subunit delta
MVYARYAQCDIASLTQLCTVSISRRDRQSQHQPHIHTTAMSEPPVADAAPPPAAAPPEPKKISPAELKKQKAAEKQARRAQEKAAQGAPAVQQKPQKEPKLPPKDGTPRPNTIRRRPSTSNAPPPTPVGPKKEPKKAVKQVGLFFGHLYSQPRQHSVVGASKDVHPAILALGLQYSSYIICGSTARMVSMLLAFKRVIEDYQTPVGTSLARHLTSHHLSPQIDFLRSCRPLSISMGNAIRWLKDSMYSHVPFIHVQGRRTPSLVVAVVYSASQIALPYYLVS